MQERPGVRIPSGGAAPPPGLANWLNLGSALALLVAVAGAMIAFRLRASAAALRDRAAARRYGIIVGVEFGLAGIGAGILGAVGQADLIPVLVCAIVGLHFFPLAPVLRDRLLVPLGALLCLVAATALVVALATDIAASTVTGVGAGGLLLASAALALTHALR